MAFRFRKFLPWRKRRSPARPPAAVAHIMRGDEARSRKDWAGAAEGYRAAVAEAPGLTGIWVQLGHAQKEQGAIEPAIQAYARAAENAPLEADAHIHLAHLTKDQRNYDAAIGHFLRALHADGHSSAQSEELMWLIAHYRGTNNDSLVTLLRNEVGRLPARSGEATLLTQLRDILAEDMAMAERAPDPRPTLVFDISDLISYYANARLPTGIQRVQIETIEGAVQQEGNRDIRLCCFIDGRDEWLEIPLDQMRAIARLSTAGGDRFEPQWVAAIARLRLFLSLTRPLDFPQGASLINLGTSWWLQNYFLFVRRAKAARGIRYIPFVHDMIPIMTPEHCTRGLTQDFISWVIGVFDHADHFLCNSDATCRDLITVARTLGHDIAPEDVAVIPLDTDFRKAERVRLPDSALAKMSLEPGGFVLFVSTIESRKGHLIAFDTWAELIRRHGADKVPKLVCVGNRGWLNSKIYRRLETNPELAERVVMLSKLTDEELALLYRSCRFTLYPSLYEGWGLPVTESLCYGKVPLTSDAASLPQAGGELAVYAQAGSVEALVEAAEKLILDTAYREALEQRIVAEFKPRSWSDLARQIGEELDRFAVRDASEPVTIPTPQARIGAWHALTRNEETRIWPGMRTAEIFRSGLGWHPPEARGSRVRREGGDLRLALPGGHAALRIFFHLEGDEHTDSQWVIRCGDVSLVGDLPPRQARWIVCDVPPADAPHILDIHFAALPAEDDNVPTYFVGGFFLCEADDTQARLAFIEAVALNRLETLGAFRER